MSSAAEELPVCSFEDFLTIEATSSSDRRHEWVSGRVYVMAGGSERHALAAGLMYEALAPTARRSGCRPFIADRLLRTDHAAYYPDVLVVCGPSQHRLFEKDATVVVEVLSPSTRDVDRREKASAYSVLAGLRAYVLVDPERPRIEVATRIDGGELSWQAFGPADVVMIGDVALDVDDYYATLDLTATS